MKLSEVVKICSAAIPREVEYMKGEPYGLYNFKEDIEVKTALYCVTPTPAVVDLAKERYDLLISHHPYIQRGIPHLIYHTALDCCEGGLNDQWRDALGVKNAKHFDKELGWYGEIEPIKYFDLVKKVKDYCGGADGQRYLKPGADDIIRTVVICTGLGGLVTEKALTSKADCYILGEMCCLANETGFKAVIETGHTNSEWMGVNVFNKLLNPHGIVVDLAPPKIDVYGTEVFKPFGRKRNYGGYQF